MVTQGRYSYFVTHTFKICNVQRLAGVRLERGKKQKSLICTIITKDLIVLSDVEVASLSKRTIWFSCFIQREKNTKRQANKITEDE